MKRLFNYLLLFVTLFVFSGVVVSANEFVVTGGAGYRVIERLESNELHDGIVQYTDKSESLRGGLPYSQEISVLEVGPNSGARIFSSSDFYTIPHRWNRGTVTELAQHFENSNPGWRVIGAVNGDFFDINGNGNLPYQTNNSNASDGEVYKSNNGWAVGFKNDGTLSGLVGGRPTRTTNMSLAVYDENDEIIQEYVVQKRNSEPEAGETSVYFGTYGSTKEYIPIEVNTSSAKFIVEAAELTLPNSSNDFYGKGIINSSRNITLQIGQFAVVSKDSAVIEALGENVKIRVQYEFTGDFEDATTITGQNGNFLVRGEYSSANLGGNLNERHPRTVVGVKSDGTLVFSIINGRAEGSGRDGMYGNELAAFMKSVGAKTAFNLDGGGSSYMIIREDGEFALKTHPSDGVQRRNSNALIIAVPAPHVEVEIQQETNQLDFNVDIIDDNGFDLSEIHVKVGEETKQVIDGKASFTDLTSNTQYHYEILSKDKAGTTELLKDSLIKTRKLPYDLQHISIVEENLVYRLSVVYDDPDGSSNLRMSDIEIDGVKFSFKDDNLLVLKSQLQNPIYKIKISFKYDDNTGEKEVLVDSIHIRLVTSSVNETLNDLFIIHNKALKNIFN